MQMMGARGKWEGGVGVSLLSVLITSCTFFGSMSELFSFPLLVKSLMPCRHTVFFCLCFLCFVPDGLGWIITTIREVGLSYYNYWVYA